MGMSHPGQGWAAARGAAVKRKRFCGGLKAVHMHLYFPQCGHLGNQSKTWSAV